MLLSRVPLTCRCRGDTPDRLREAKEWPEHYGSSADQLANKRVCLRVLVTQQRPPRLRRKTNWDDLRAGVRRLEPVGGYLWAALAHLGDPARDAGRDSGLFHSVARVCG